MNPYSSDMMGYLIACGYSQPVNWKDNCALHPHCLSLQCLPFVIEPTTFFSDARLCIKLEGQEIALPWQSDC